MTVGILTFRRPDGLRESLPRLLEQVRQVPGAELLVIDNDDVPSAQGIVAEREAAGDPVRYVHEPDPGIVSARNRALDEAEWKDGKLVASVRKLDSKVASEKKTIAAA